MKQVLLCLLYWSYIKLSASLPTEEKPGFTLWPLEKRALTPLTALQFSAAKGTPLGVLEKSNFGIPDPTCRDRLPGEGCWTMDEFTVDVSSQPLGPYMGNIELYRKCSMPACQRQMNAKSHVFFTLKSCQVQQRERQISFYGMFLRSVLLKDHASIRLFGYVICHNAKNTIHVGELILNRICTIANIIQRTLTWMPLPKLNVHF
jgi:hypothetical protein